MILGVIDHFLYESKAKIAFGLSLEEALGPLRIQPL